MLDVRHLAVEQLRNNLQTNVDMFYFTHQIWQYKHNQPHLQQQRQRHDTQAIDLDF